MRCHRTWLAVPLIFILLCCTIRHDTSAEMLVAISTPGRKSANLQEQLEAGLKARRSEEFAFLRRVVRMVDERQLPSSLVRSTFDWARTKRPYPYPFFERGLKVRAARQGIIVR